MVIRYIVVLHVLASIVMGTTYYCAEEGKTNINEKEVEIKTDDNGEVTLDIIGDKSYGF